MQHVSTCVFLVAFLLGVLPTHSRAQRYSDSEGSESLLEVLSLYEAHHANLDSLESMDVMFELSRNSHSEDTLAFDETITKQRVVLDEEHKLGVVGTVYEVRRFIEGKKSQPLAMNVVVSVRVGDRVGQRHFPEQTTWVNLDKEHSFGWASDHPDFRFIGHYPFPISAGVMSPTMADSILRIPRTARPGLKLQMLPNQKAQVERRDDSKPRQLKVSKHVFDLRNGYLESSRTSRSVVDSTEMVPGLVERYEWRTLEGVFVPGKIYGERKRKRPSKWNLFQNETTVGRLMSLQDIGKFGKLFGQLLAFFGQLLPCCRSSLANCFGPKSEKVNCRRGTCSANSLRLY